MSIHTIPKEWFQFPKEEIITQTKSEINWKRIDYNSARRMFGFKIYSIRNGSIAEYALGLKPPNSFWLEISSSPSETTFEWATLKDKTYILRMNRYGRPEKLGIFKCRKINN